MVLISTPTLSSGWKIKAGSSARRVVGFSLNVRLSLFNLHCSSSFFIYLKAVLETQGLFQTDWSHCLSLLLVAEDL